MKVFVKTNLGEVLEIIGDFMSSHGLQVTQNTGETSRSTIIVHAKEKRGLKAWSVCWQIDSTPHGCMVEYDIKPSVAHHVCLIGILLGFSALTLLIGVDAFLEWPGILRNLGRAVAYLAALGLAIIQTILIIRDLKTQTMAWAHLIYNSLPLSKEVISSWLGRSSPLWPIHAFAISIELTWAALSYRYAPVSGLALLSAVMVIHMVMIGFQVSVNDDGLVWRSMFFRFASGWQIFVVVTIMVFGLVSFVHVSLGSADPAIKRERTHIESFDQRLREAMIRPLPEDVIADPVGWNREMLRERLEETGAGWLKYVVFCLPVPLFILLFCYAGATGLWLWAKEWGTSRVTPENVSAAPLGVMADRKKELLFSIIVWLVWLVGAVWNITLAGISLIVWMWLVTGSAAIWPQVVVIVTWLQAMPMLCSCALGGGYSGLQLLWNALLVSMCLPGFGLLVLASSKLGRMLFQSKVARVRARRRKGYEARGIEALVGEESSRIGIRRPTVCVTRGAHIGSSASWSPVAWRGMIALTTGAVELLDERMLRAVVRHELAHLRFDCRRLGWLRFLSSLGLFPFPILVSVIDSVGAELRADSFAVEHSTDRRSLLDALEATVEVNEVVTLRQEKERSGGVAGWLSRRRRRGTVTWNLLRKLMWDDSLLAYSYPLLEFRMANLRAARDT